MPSPEQLAYDDLVSAWREVADEEDRAMRHIAKLAEKERKHARLRERLLWRLRLARAARVALQGLAEAQVRRLNRARREVAP